MSLFARLIAGAVLALICALPATAVPPKGSAAWTTNGWINFDGKLYSGPGTEYAVTGDVASGVRIRVDRCSKLWCQIHVGHAHGWLPLGNVSFGQHPTGWLSGPRFPTLAGAGTVCFYTGGNYSGAKFCASSGHVYKDLKLIGYDNAFSSARIDGAASAMVCRDRGFRSYCKIIDLNSSHLEGLLDNGISSIRIY